MSLLNHLEHWKEQMLGEVCSKELDRRGLYKETGNLSHYSNLADMLAQKTGSLDLAYAAFLHGLTPSQLPQSTPKSVKMILRERALITALEGRVPGTRQNLMTNVLPSLSVDSVVLTVYDQLGHLDPDRKLEEWTRAFVTQPTRFKSGARRLFSNRLKTPEALAEHHSLAVMAPLAEKFGMWLERNLFQNLYMYYCQAHVFKHIVDLVISSEPNRVIEMIRKGMSDHYFDQPKMHWEWRHVYSIYTRLPTNKPERIGRDFFQENVHHFGHITILCENEQECYLRMYQLHRSFNHDKQKLVSSLFSVKDSYQALHTYISLPNTDGLDSGDINVSVRFILSKDLDNRFISLKKKRYKDLGTIIDRERFMQEGLFAFAEDGRKIDFQEGMNVLNFAFKIHNSWISRIGDVYVNRELVSPFYKLQPRDMVHIKLQDGLTYLPDGWEKSIVGKNKKILYEYKRQIKPHLMECGYRFLFSNYQINSEDVVRNWIASAIRKCGKNPTKLWIDRIVIHFGMKHDTLEHKGRSRPFDYEMVHEIWKRFIVKLNDEVRLYQLDWQNYLDLDHVYDEISRCKSCKPDFSLERFCGERYENSLRLHVPGKCRMRHSFFIDAKVRTYQRYFLVLCLNKIGLLEDVCAVFSRNVIDISELHSHKIGVEKFIIRIRTDVIILPEKASILQQALMRMPFVLLAVDPEKEMYPELENHLPSRYDVADLGSFEIPYQGGAPINDEERFYGREIELKQLQDKFFELVKKQNQQGQCVFIYGARRVGKSSLSLAFYRMLIRNLNQAFAFVYVECFQSWAQTEKIILRNFKDAIKNKVSPEAFSTLSELDSFTEFMKQLSKIKNLLVVLVVDEFPVLFGGSDKQEQENASRALQGFVSYKNNFLILVGAKIAFPVIRKNCSWFFHKADFIHLDDLDYDVSHKIIQAGKKFGKGRIVISKSLSKSIFKITGGNPYWINRIAGEMFKTVIDSHKVNSHSPIRYSRKAFQDAIQSLYEEKVPFDERFFPLNHGSSAYRKHVLTVLSKLSEDPNGYKEHQIAGELTQKMDEAQLLQILKDLHNVGTVKLINRDQDSRIWKFSAPILIDYFKLMY